MLQASQFPLTFGKIRNMKKISFLLFAASILLLGACKNETKKITYTLDNLQFNLEGPLFEGPNTAQVPVQLDLAKITGIPKANGSQIKSVKLVGCEINAPEGQNFNPVSNVVLQLAADKVDMTEIALLNPIPQSSQSIAPQPKANELSSFFQQGNIIVLLDATLIADQEESLSFTGKLSFELEVTN
ncbi:hypothetical protein MASR2M44_03650 [Bacteroidota bacterium]